MKITKFESKTFQNQSTGKSNTSYTVGFDDGSMGYLDDKSSDKGLAIGDEVNYLLTVKQNKSGQNYNLFTVKKVGTATPPPTSTVASPPQQKAFASPVAQVAAPKNIKELKVDAAISAMEFAFSAYCEGKIDYPKIPETQRDAVTILWKEIDEIFSE